MFILIGFVLAAIIAVGLVVFFRWFAARENPTIFTFNPAQRHALVTTKSVSPTEAKGADKTEEQGNIVDVIHAIPGKWLDKSSSNSWGWYYKDEDEEKGYKEPRGLLYILFGVVFIGFFRYLRLNEVRTFRWGRKDGESEYHMQAKSSLTRFPFFSGQHDIELKGVETKQILKLDMLLNVIFEETYPVRVRLRTADPYAVLTMMVTRHIISRIGGVEDPKGLVQDKELQKNLADEIQKDVAEEVVAELGITIKKVTLADIDFDEATKELLERKARAGLEAEANLITAKNKAAQEVAIAEGDRQARILRNEGDAHRVEHVIKPLAENERTVQVAGFDAYRDNETLTTLVIGQGALPTVPVTAK